MKTYHPLGGVRVVVAAGVVLMAPGAMPGQESGPTLREFTVSARRFEFAPPRLEVRQDDLVKVTLQSDDIAHSFTIDSYRIAKRVGGKQSVTFEFRANQSGSFPFYCNLDLEDGCKAMRGQLIVAPR